MFHSPILLHERFSFKEKMQKSTIKGEVQQLIDEFANVS